MKAFWASVAAAIVLAVVSAAILNEMQYGTADVYKSTDVRL